MKTVVGRTAEYCLGRELHKPSDRHEPCYRIHWPVHYYYDLLVGLDCLPVLGYRKDQLLGYSVNFLRKKQRPHGRWDLDSLLPDPYRELVDWFAKHLGKCPVRPTFEAEGKPIKMVALRALTVRSRVG